MPRTNYHRKRPGYRSYVAALWRRLDPFMQGEAALAADPVATHDLAALRSEGLSDEQIATLVDLFAKFGRLVAESMPAATASNKPSRSPPEFFELGAEMPAGCFNRASRLLQFHLRPKGRPRKPARGPSRPTQAEVDHWMLSHGEAAFGRDHRPLKETAAVTTCMKAINASRMQARVAFTRLPLELRRQRGQHDRWVKPSSF